MSTGQIDFDTDIRPDSNKKRIVDSTVDIWNATNFSANVSLYGFSGVNKNQLGLFSNRRVFLPRTYGLLCAHNTLHKKKEQRIIEFGSRQIDDFLVRFMRETVSNENQNFPSHTFDFTDEHININYVKLMLNVSANMYNF